MKLHLGCGTHLLDGWTNTDINRPHATLDVRSPFPLADFTCTHVFAEHLIEHIERDEAEHMLSECYRVLCHGGKIRIATPDLRALARMLDYNDEEAQRYLAFQGRTPCEQVNNLMREGGAHRFIYDDVTLRAALERAGFQLVRRCFLGESTDPELRWIENESRMPPGMLAFESFVLEATKP